MLNETSATDRAAAQSVATIFTSVGQLVGAAVVGAIAASIGGLGGYSASFLTFGFVGLVLAMLAFGLKSRPQELATVAANQALVPAQAGPTAGVGLESSTTPEVPATIR
jgi:MFS family permease